MDKNSSLPELIVVLNERENSAKTKESADNYFKKEVREHIRDAQPVLIKAKEAQEIKGKLFVAVASVIIIGLIGAFITLEI